ncbi:MAG: DUF1385 domain-containing protein [Chloroflexi bacterium]|nr:DUF1385 domain-containing protein [Chloroflexota bacterium]
MNNVGNDNVMETTKEQRESLGWSYGGQAVMEGVMMRGKYLAAVAVRKPSPNGDEAASEEIDAEGDPNGEEAGEIVVKTEELGEIYRGWISKTPFLRGLPMLWDALGLGMRALFFSAEIVAEAEGEEVEMNTSTEIAIGAISIALGLGLFMVLPTFVAGLILNEAANPLLFNLLEGGVRLTLMLGYMIAIAQMEEIRRVFAYHGAEHKTINAYEDGAPLTVEGVRPYSRQHARCGTAFLLIVVLISVLVFAPLGRPSLPVRILSRLLMIPVITGIAYEWLREEMLAPMQPVDIEARDGLILPSYLTLPPGSDGKNLPMVLNVHGGPWARDSWGYNSEVQLMANRGYAVLQVNFRSSEGFGQDFRNAGRKEWGRKMQHDLTDAVQWAIDEGIADPDRICIYGASYGGYAAMAGATFTPDLYQCAVNYVGVTDITLLYDSNAAWKLLRPELIRDVGDPEEEREMLEARSPINHADKIEVPILMAYGREDPRVVLDHALNFEKELEKHDVEYELIIKDNEGHGFAKFENQVEWYTTLIDFLDDNLKGPDRS